MKKFTEYNTEPNDEPINSTSGLVQTNKPLNVDLLDSFSRSYSSFKENIDRVESFLKDSSGLVKRDEFETTFLSHLLMVNESIQNIKADVVGINESDLSRLEIIIENLDGKTVNITDYIDSELPKIKKSLVESEFNQNKSFSSVRTNIEEVNESISFLKSNIKTDRETDKEEFNESITQSISFLKSNMEDSINLSIDNIYINIDKNETDIIDQVSTVNKNLTSQIDQIYGEVKLINSNLDSLTEQYDTTLNPAIEQLNIFNERLDNVIDIQNDNLLKAKEDIRGVINEVNTIFINAKYVELDNKIERIEQIFNALNSKNTLNEISTYETEVKDVKPASEIHSIDQISKILSDKSFQQPNPDPVSPDFAAVTAKLKFLEQAIGRIAATGPGGGEVNLRWLDDIDRTSIGDGKYLRYNATTKKFEFGTIDPQVAEADTLDSVTTRGNVTTNGISVNSLTLPVGSLIEETATIEVIIADLVLDTVIDYSSGPGDTLPIGTIGNTSGIAHPWAIYRFTTTPTPTLEINDVIAGAAVPVGSTLTFVGSGLYDKYVVADKVFPLGVPANGITITTVRPIVNASLSIQTEIDTDIVFETGGGTGVIVNHSDIVPYTNNVYSLGTPTKRFEQLWLGGGTIFIADTVLGIDLGISAFNGDLIVQGGAGLQVGQFRFRNNQLFLTDPDTEIIIGTTGATAPVTFKRTIQVRNSTDEYDLLDVDQQGRVTILSDIATDPTEAAMSIVGARARDVQSPANLGVLLQLTGSSTAPSRIYHDSYGAANYSAFIGRKARGNSTTPTQVLANDIISRIGANPYKETSFSDISTMRMDFVAKENQTNSAQGNEIQFWTTANSSSTILKRLSLDSTGIVLTSLGGGGITFADSTRQTTAWLGTYSYNNLTDKPNVVTAINVTSGLTVGRVNGTVTLGNSGVLSVAAATGTGQLGVNTVGGAVTLTMPQGLGTTNNVTFNDLIITGTLTVENFELSTAPTIAGKILYLAADATVGADIDGGGIWLGPIADAYSRSLLYNLEFDRWDTDGAGLKTLELDANDIYVEGQGHFGNAYNDYDFPGAAIQIDGSLDSYLQVVNKNHNDGVSASADFVATNDIGDDTIHYIDMGINSSNYTDAAWPILTGNDGYMYINGGNLRIGTDTATKDIKFFTGGTLVANVRATISDTGLNVVGTTTSTAFSGPLTGNVTGNASGNAGTATKLQTARNINGVLFDGSADITVTAAAGTLTGTTLASNVLTSSLTSVGTLGNLTVTNAISGSVTGNAGTVTNGVYTTGNQTIGGTKTFSSTITGSITGNAGTVTNGVYTTDTGTVTNTMLAGSIANNKLANSTISGVALGGSLFNLTAGTGITFSSGTTYNGSAAITINATASGVTSLASGTNIILSGSTGAVTIQRVDGLQTVVTANSGATYNVTTTDQYVGTTRSATGTGTITLPLGSTVTVGRQYIIKDEGGQSGNFFRRITVAASGSDTIDGSATRSITSNYGALTVLWTGTRWSVI